MDRRAPTFLPAAFAALVSVVTLAACSENGSATAVDGGKANKPCGPPPGAWVEGRDSPAHCVREVSGSVRGEGGGPISGLSMTVCGVACFGGQTQDDGSFRVRVDAHLPDNGYALFAHGRPYHASLFVRLPPSPPERLAIPTIELPALSPEGVPLPADDGPGGTVSVGPIALTIPTGTSFALSFEDATDDVNGRLVRFAKVPAERAPLFAAGAALVYALAPFEARASKPIAIAISETSGLAPGAAVEIVAMHGIDLESENTSGLSFVAAKAHVNSAGTRIESDPGEGLPVLTWIAVRPAP